MNSWQDYILAGPHINQVLTFLQDHILAAMITTQKSLPCLQEMVHNYLSEARLRSWEDDYGLDDGLDDDGLDDFGLEDDNLDDNGLDDDDASDRRSSSDPNWSVVVGSPRPQTKERPAVAGPCLICLFLLLRYTFTFTLTL